MPTKTSRRTFKSRTTRKPAHRTSKAASRWSGKKTASRWSGKKTTARWSGKKTAARKTRKARRTTATKARRTAWKAAKTWKIGSWSRPARRAA